MATQIRKVKCPTCKDLTEYSPVNDYRPFCSKRCRLIDLGDWAEESFSVAADEQPSPEELELAFLEKLQNQ